MEDMRARPCSVSNQLTFGCKVRWVIFVTQVAFPVLIQPFEAIESMTLDVFTQKRFKGNQLAVVDVTSRPTSAQLMQTIAQEFGFSETVFLDKTDPHNAPKINIFTPASEIELAGHPVIGTGHVLFRNLLQGHPVAAENSVEIMAVQTKAGIVDLRYDPQQQLVSAQIPHNVHIHSKVADKKDIIATQPSLPSAATSNMRDTYPLVSIVKGVSFVLIDCSENTTLFDSVKPGPNPQCELDDAWSPSFIGVTYYKLLDRRSKDGKTSWNLRVRMIAINLEDPATGSACCALASYLALSAGGADSTHCFDISQGTEIGRDSNIIVEITLDGSGEKVGKVVLSGHSVPVNQGSMFLTE
ncbi:hypothetical protein N0V90_010112 [Kalmusia sp. IMI 367209]|nr:hypothetical protein N0V90_010112 [Kalmusia sp. IMI 367209]